MRNRVNLALAAALCLSVAVATANGAWAANGLSAKASLVMKETSGHYAFSPGKKTVKVGTQVTWTNRSDAPHTVTSLSMKRFLVASKPIAQHKTFSVTFKHAGVFKYHCTFHPGMVGTITVVK